MTTHRNRNYRDAAQGVERWYRTINGRTLQYVYVVRGWWGVGETGDLTVSRAISNGDYYPIHRFRNVTGQSGWSDWAGYSKV